MSEQTPVPPSSVDEALTGEALQQKLEESQKKALEYFDRFLRLQAEFDNYRKRLEKEKADARQWGKQEILLPLLSLIDVFEQAISQAQHAKDVKQIVQGLGFLHKNFEVFLKAQGLEPVDALGKTFDPHLAEAVEQVEVEDENESGKVLAELQKGYTFQGKILLRPSRVRVGVLRKSAAEPDEATAENE